MPDRPLTLKLFIIFFLIVLTYIAFCRVLNHDFITLDDDIYIINNIHVQRGLNLKDIVWAFSRRNEAGLWIPLTWLSFMLDSQLYGLNAGGYHLTNLLIHTLNALLLFLAFDMITGRLWQSASVAALFALHPLRVESVAWVTERKDVLSALFFILAIWAYAFYSRTPDFKRYALVLIAFFLGLMAKPMLVTLPFVLLLLDYWPLDRFQSKGFLADGEWFTNRNKHKARLNLCHNKGCLADGEWFSNTDSLRRESYGNNDNKQKRYSIAYLVFEKVPLFSLAAIFSILTFLDQKGAGPLASFEAAPLNVRIANSLVSYIRYIAKMLWPVNIAVLYPYSGELPKWHFVIGASLLLLIISLAVWKAHRPYLVMGWLWFLDVLFPVIGLAQSGLQAIADRFTYIPLIGLFIIISWGIPDILNGWPNSRAVLAVSASMLLPVLIIGARLQTKFWQDSRTLYDRALDVTDNNWLIHYNLGPGFGRGGRC
ncbi:hypothetical protein JXL19_11850 [bacterium]|nr:hypothetical protein [bacterium]